MAFYSVAALCACALLLLGLLVPETLAKDQYARRVSYRGEIVVRCPDKNKATVKVLQQHSDVWHTGKESVDMRIKGSAFSRVQDYFPECTVMIQDLEAHVQRAEAQMFPKKKAQQEAWMQDVVKAVLPQGGDLKDCEAKVEEWEAHLQMTKSWFDEYHDFDSIIKWYEDLEKAFPQLVTIKSIGQTVQNREMHAVHFTGTRPNSNKKKFYIQCQIHAREWISGAVCMYLVNHLVRGYSDDQRVQHLMDNLEFVLIPFVNPDGYVYTWTNDRMWRKNRRDLGDGCIGVDINRNYPEGFKLKSKSHCREEDYGGPAALSEVETQHVVNHFRASAPIIGSLDVHSYGELLLRPWGEKNDTAPDDEFHRRVGNTMVAEIRKIHGSEYTSETSHDLYYCYGIAADWFYGDDASRTNKGYRSASFCVELRSDSSGEGFLLPPEQIIPTAEEVLPGILYYMEEVQKHPIRYTPPPATPSYSSRFSSHQRIPLRHST